MTTSVTEPITVLSGIRSTQDRLHVGNYFGASQKWLALENEFPGQSFFFVADLHSIGDVTSGPQLAANNLSVATEFLAIGLDPNKSTLYIQSAVPELAVLTWLLTAVTQDTSLLNLPHYREKRDKFRTQAGVEGGPATYLVYPILQAADILYPAGPGSKILVPVGDDQRTHIEFTRDLARAYNRTYQPIFGEPTMPEDIAIYPGVDQADKERAKSVRIKGLDGKEKMGKSEGNAIYLDYEPKQISQLIKRGVTDPQRQRQGDPGDPDKCIGIYPLHIHVTSIEERQQLIRPGCLSGELNCSDCKQILTNGVTALFAEFRDRKRQLLAKPDLVHQVFGDGAAVVRRLVREKVAIMSELMGLSIPSVGP